MSNLIEQRIFNVFQTNEVFFQRVNTQSTEQAKMLMIETLQTIVILIQELVNHFRTISTQSGSEDLQLISEKCTELEEKSEQLNKLTNWYVNEEGKESDGKKRTIVFDRIESFLISTRTVIINARAKTDYSGQMMLVEYELSQKSYQTYSMALFESGKRLYRSYISPNPIYQWIKGFIVKPVKIAVNIVFYCVRSLWQFLFLVFTFLLLPYCVEKLFKLSKLSKLFKWFRQAPNKKSDPPLTEITTKPPPKLPKFNSFEMIYSVSQIKLSLDQMNQLADRYKPLAEIVSDVKKWFNEH